MKRRLWKERAYLEKNKRNPYCRPANYQLVSFSIEIDFLDCESNGDEDYSLLQNERYALMYNPNLSRANFVYENWDMDQRREMENLQKQIFVSSGLDSESEVEGLKCSGRIKGEASELSQSTGEMKELEEFKKEKIQGRDIAPIKIEVQGSDDQEDIDALKKGSIELSIREKEMKEFEDFEEISYQSSMSDFKMEDWEDIGEQSYSSEDFA